MFLILSHQFPTVWSIALTLCVVSASRDTTLIVQVDSAQPLLSPMSCPTVSSTVRLPQSKPALSVPLVTMFQMAHLLALLGLITTLPDVWYIALVLMTAVSASLTTNIMQELRSVLMLFPIAPLLTQQT